ncbi:MAG: helix-turn-helix domain-containing protein [Candidatus Obscuribacterales bacterium]|nr:helix-turn-helix domain-containing protein [Candidatus Obscuribacterales bacterium]
MTKNGQDDNPYDVVDYLYDKYIKGDPEAEKRLEQYEEDSHVAQLIYDMREESGLTQAQLAKLVGTSPSVISRLEDSDYQGHSLTMLKRIADALGKRVEVRVVSKNLSPKSKSQGQTPKGSK